MAQTTIMRMSSRPEQPAQQVWELPYNRDDHKYNVDLMSNCAIDYLVSDNYKSRIFYSETELDDFQNAVRAKVMCNICYDICQNVWYNCCEGLHKPCGTFWCLICQIPTCLLIGCPWMVCCGNSVKKATIKRDRRPDDPKSFQERTEDLANALEHLRSTLSRTPAPAAPATAPAV